MRAIKEELGDNDDDEDDLAALESKMQSAGMPSNIWKHAQRELRYGLIIETLNALITFEQMLMMKMCACHHLAIASILLWTGITYKMEVFLCATCFSYLS